MMNKIYTPTSNMSKSSILKNLFCSLLCLFGQFQLAYASSNCSLSHQKAAQAELSLVLKENERIASKATSTLTQSDMDSMKKSVLSLSKSTRSCFTASEKLMILILKISGLVCTTDDYQENIDFLLSLESHKLFRPSLSKVPEAHQVCINRYIKASREAQLNGTD